MVPVKFLEFAPPLSALLQCVLNIMFAIIILCFSTAPNLGKYITSITHLMVEYGLYTNSCFVFRT